MSPNGKLVHLADAAGTPVCGYKVLARHKVHARITCQACARRRPHKAARLEQRPHVVGLNWDPLYAALRRALEAELTVEPRVLVPYWPVLARPLADTAHFGF